MCSREGLLNRNDLKSDITMLGMCGDRKRTGEGILREKHRVEVEHQKNAQVRRADRPKRVRSQAFSLRSLVFIVLSFN